MMFLPALPLPEVTQLQGGRASLRDLPGVAVIAEEVSSDVRPFGLSADWMEKRVSGALQRGTVPVLVRYDAASRDRQPLLVARIQTVRFPGRQTFAWHCSLALHQRVVAGDARASRVLATTWEATATIGITNGSSLTSSLGETLDRQAAEFARDWKLRATDE
jgi:hypothetical protein